MRPRARRIGADARTQEGSHAGCVGRSGCVRVFIECVGVALGGDDEVVIDGVFRVQGPRVHGVEEIQAHDPPLSAEDVIAGLDDHAAAPSPDADVYEVSGDVFADDPPTLLREALHERGLEHGVRLDTVELEVVKQDHTVDVLPHHFWVVGASLLTQELLDALDDVSSVSSPVSDNLEQQPWEPYRVKVPYRCNSGEQPSNIFMNVVLRRCIVL